MKKYWIAKGLMFLLLFAAFVLLLGLVVMGLWNTILPTVLGVKAITFAQALGILLLSKILFGGFHNYFHRGAKERWGKNIQQRISNMTPEEKEKFKSEWKDRCSGRWVMRPKENADVTER